MKRLTNNQVGARVAFLALVAFAAMAWLAFGGTKAHGAWDLGDLDSTQNTPFNIIIECFDSLAQQKDPDSLWLIVFARKDASAWTLADTLPHRIARTTTVTDWLDRYKPWDVDNIPRQYVYRDVARTIIPLDDIATDTMFQGRFEGVLYVWIKGWPWPNHFQGTAWRNKANADADVPFVYLHRWEDSVGDALARLDALISSRSTLTTTDNIGINWGDVSNPTATVTMSSTAIGTVENLGSGAIQAVDFAGGAINAAALDGTAATEIADSAWRSGASKYRVGGNYTAAAWKDSVIAAAFASAGGGAGYRTKVIVDLDSAAGTLSDAQIDQVGVDVLAISGGTAAANNAELFFDGTGYAGTGNTIPTVTTVTNSIGTTLGAAEVEVAAADKIGFAAINMGDDSASWISGADTSAMRHLQLLDKAITGVAAGGSGNDSLQIRRWVWDSTSGKYSTPGDIFYKRVIDTILETLSECGAGTGLLSDTVYAVDTSGTDTAIPNVLIQAKNASGTPLGQGMTTGNGYTVLNLPQSVSVTFTGFLPGYTWPSRTLTMEAGLTDTDSLFGYDLTVSVASPPSSQMTTVYGNAAIGTDTLKNGLVHVTLVGAKGFYTSTGAVVPVHTKVFRANASGDWQGTVYGTDSLTAFGSGTATYTIRYEHPLLTSSGVVIEFSGLRVSANGATTSLKSILAQ